MTKGFSRAIVWVASAATALSMAAPAMAFQAFPGSAVYEWVGQSGTNNGVAHVVNANAGDTVNMSLTFINRSQDASAKVWYGSDATIDEPGMPHAHEIGIGTARPNDNTPSWLDSSSFVANGNRFAYYNGPAVFPGQTVTLTWDVKIADNAANGTYKMYTNLVREYDSWFKQMKNNVILPDTDIFWEFVIGGGTSGNANLEGGAGSVDSYALIAGLANEEVGEDEEDVEVAGLEIEVDEGSDLEFTAVRLVFDEGTGATNDFEDYASEVSIWLDGEEVGRVDADVFNDNNNWTSTVSLDGAIAERGTTVELTVAITGIGNLDTADAADEWNVDFRQVRFTDADGSSISEDPATAAITFSFELFATAASTNFKISQGAEKETVTDAHVINVHATDATNDVPILSFNVEIEGDSDVTVDDLPVNIDTTVTSNNTDDIITALSLWMDGDEVGSASISSDCEDDADCVDVGTDETYLFKDMDLTLEAGQDYEFIVKADLFALNGGDLDVGDTIAANIGEALLEDANNNADIEDETGVDLVAADLSGTVTGAASEFRDVGFNASLVSATAVVTAGEQAVNSDVGTFVITFDVTAFDGSVWIDESAPTVSVATTDGQINLTQTTATGTVLCIMEGVSNYTEGTGAKEVQEGETARFRVTCDVRDGGTDLADNYVNFAINDIRYSLTEQDGDLSYTFNLTDWVTPSVYLDDRE